MTDYVGNTDWSEKFARLSPDRREKMLNRAARLIADPQANPNEREMSARQLQVALEVDPNLVLDVLASVRMNQPSSVDIEKFKREAALTQSNFDGLVNATQTLRISLTEMGVIAKDSRLPETAEEWQAAIGKVVARESRHLKAKEDYLLEQKRELERRRAEILGEINEARNRLQEEAPLLSKLSLGMFSPLKARIANAGEAISSLSFDFDHIEAREVGQLVRGEGIFAGLWTPRYKNNTPVGIECEMYAAPEDLRHAPSVGGLQTYLNTVKEVAGLRNWHGHDGGNFANDEAVIGFLDKTAKDFLKTKAGVGVGAGEWFRPDGIGKWFIPPRDILYGKNANGDVIREENLYSLRDAGDFRGTFTTASGSDDAHWYWSSTETRDNSDYVWTVAFTDGADGWGRKDLPRLSCRPCRVGRVRHLTI